MADKVVEVFDLIKDMTVLELNDLRKKIEDEFDVKAVAGVAAAAPADGAGEDAAASTVSVFITAPGAKKIEVIKVVRAATGLPLKDAKEVVESAGAKAVKESIEKADADKLAADLKAAGAEVEIK